VVLDRSVPLNPLYELDHLDVRGRLPLFLGGRVEDAPGDHHQEPALVVRHCFGSSMSSARHVGSSSVRMMWWPQIPQRLS